jgi:hypothetical protein
MSRIARNLTSYHANLFESQITCMGLGTVCIQTDHCLQVLDQYSFSLAAPVIARQYLPGKQNEANLHMVSKRYSLIVCNLQIGNGQTDHDPNHNMHNILNFER